MNIEEDLDDLRRRTCYSEHIPRYDVINGTVLGCGYVDIKSEIDNLVVKDSDIWISTYPKSGTTWTQEMIWLMVNNFDYIGSNMALYLRFPYLEIQCFRKYLKDFEFFSYEDDLQESVKYVKNYKTDPRLIKTHLPWDLLPKSIQNKDKRPKVIYVIRDPKDVCVSFFYHYRAIENYKGTFEEFCKLFLNDKLIYAPYWNNINGYWEQRNEPNVLILRYEDMVKDLKSVAIRVANFIDRKIPDHEMDKFSKHLTFNSMKENKSTHLFDDFVRKGIVGDYKNEMTPELIEEFNVWIKKNNKFNIAF